MKDFMFRADDGEKYVKNAQIIDFSLDTYEKIWNNKEVEEINENYLFILFNRNEEELEEISEICTESKEIAKMVKDVNKKHAGYLTIGEDELRINNSMLEEARDKALEEGTKIGIEEGTKNTQKEVVLNMLNKRMDLELISEITNLSIEEIENIKNKGC